MKIDRPEAEKYDGAGEKKIRTISHEERVL